MGEEERGNDIETGSPTLSGRASEIEAPPEGFELTTPALPPLTTSWDAIDHRRTVTRRLIGAALLAILVVALLFFLNSTLFRQPDLAARLTPGPPVSTADQVPSPAAETPLPLASPDGSVVFEERLGQAEALYRQGDLAGAMAIYEDLAQIAPQDARPEVGWAWALILDEQAEQALEHAHRAVELEPMRADTMIVLARAYLETGELARALGMAQNAVQLAVNDAESQAILAQVYMRQGQFTQAVAAAELALASSNTSAEAHRVRGWLYYLVDGDAVRAAAEFQVAADLDPELWLRQYELGLFLARAGETERAITILSDMLGQRTSPVLLAALGEAYYRAAQPEQALKFLAQALATGGQNAGTYALLAMVTARQGRCDEAREYYAQALAQDPADSLVLEAQAICPTPTPTPAATPTNPIPSPTPMTLGGRIAFPVWNAATARYDAYLANADGSQRHLVVTEMHQPAFRPDGQWLAVNGERPEHMNLFVVRADGSDLTEVTAYIEDGSPAWSFDGESLVFSSTRHGDKKWRMYVLDQVPLGGQRLEARLLAPDRYEEMDQKPVWTPDGRIVYSGCDYTGTPVTCGLFIIPATDGPQALRQVTSHAQDTAPAVAGQRIAFMSNRDGNWEIYIVNADGSGERRLTDNSANDGLPTWSPDGKTIAFVSDRGGTWAVWALDPDGGGRQKLFDIGGGGLPQDWSQEQIGWAP